MGLRTIEHLHGTRHARRRTRIGLTDSNTLERHAVRDRILIRSDPPNAL